MNRILTYFSVVAFAFPFVGCNNPTESIDSTQRKTDSQQSMAETNSNADSSETPATESQSLKFGDQFPEVLAVKVKRTDGERWKFDVTLSSPYDTPQRYADGWRVLDGHDNELGLRVLGHDHASEQPFTRSHTIKIPNNTKLVFVEGRDQANGWSGQRFKVELP